MSECFVNYPKVPEPNEKLLGKGTNRIQTRIEEGSIFLARFHTKDGREDKTFHLPNSPVGCPKWEYAITLPAGFQDEKGLIFAFESHWCFWSFDTESPKAWKKKDAIPNSHFLMTALETDPTPFNKFCKELLLANEIFTNKKAGTLPPNYWPKGLHTYWLEILMHTNCSCNALINSDNKTQKRLQMDEKVTKDLIENLRRGAIVSMAQRYPNELKQASEIIINTTRKTPKNNKWMSLLELITL